MVQTEEPLSLGPRARKRLESMRIEWALWVQRYRRRREFRPARGSRPRLVFPGVGRFGPREW